MADHKSDRIDPRFNPAFQRGFEGEVEFAPARPDRTSSAAPGPVTQPPARYQEPATQRAVQPVGQHAGQQFAPELHDGSAAATAADEHFEGSPPRGFNPFLIGLLVVAAALIGVGVYLFQWSRDLLNVSSQVDFILAQTVIYSVPITIGLGLATAIGVAFVYAVRWRGSNSRSS